MPWRQIWRLRSSFARLSFGLRSTKSGLRNTSIACFGSTVTGRRVACKREPAALAGRFRDHGAVWFIIGAVVLVVVAGLVFGIHRFLLWAEERGWVYYKKTSPPHGAGALAMQELAQIYEPQAEHVIEATRSQSIVADHEDAGDKPFWEVTDDVEDDASGPPGPQGDG